MLDDNGQPVNVTALLADLKKERTEKAALEEKNAGLRKRLQRMLIENDKVRVRASNEVTAAQEKAKHEVAEAQKQVATVRAQIRLQDRGPDVGRTDSIVNELAVCKTQLERLKKAEADRTALFSTRYRSECRLATAEAQRVLDSVVQLFQTKLRQVGRMCRDNSDSPDLEVTCDGIRRLAFMKLLRMAHDVAFYTSAAFHSPDPVRHTIEQELLFDLFGNSLCHEERAGLFYVATAPMVRAKQKRRPDVELLTDRAFVLLL
jgi:galactokinase